MVPLTTIERHRLVHTLTQHDMRASRKKYYNPRALPLYLMALDRASNAINCGTTRREALVENFCGRLLDKMLKALAMDQSTDAEQRGSL